LHVAQLYGHSPAETAISGSVNPAHPAFTQKRFDPNEPKVLADCGLPGNAPAVPLVYTSHFPIIVQFLLLYVQAVRYTGRRCRHRYSSSSAPDWIPWAARAASRCHQFRTARFVDNTFVLNSRSDHSRS
jgi:hypothetical protein